MKHGEIKNYQELKEWASKNYNNGGSQFIECWDESTLRWYEKATGNRLTWEDVYSMAEIEAEENAMVWGF